MSMSLYYRTLRERIGHELLLIPGVAAVLRDDQGRVLIQRNHHGGWSLPAGAVEPGEAPAQAVVREVYEETGLHVRAERVLGVVGGAGCRVTHPNGDCVEYVCSVFECKRLSGSLIQSNDETFALQWFRPDQIPTLTLPYPKEVIEGSNDRAHFAWDEAWAHPLDPGT
jgi:8-oxo-dGTP pyrophosphatase MutT (NUDIX family)